MRSSSRVIPVLLVLGLSAACDRKAPKRKPFSCMAMQERMEQCQDQVVRQAKARAGIDVKTGARSAAEAEARFHRLKRRFINNIKRKSFLRRCDRTLRRNTLVERKARSTLRYCYGRSGCQAFAQCLLDRWL